MNRLLGTDKKHVSAFTLEEFKRIEEQFRAEDPVLFKRARHVLTERQRTLDFYEALLAGDLEKAGRLLNESGDSLSMEGDFAISGRVKGPQGEYYNALDILVQAGRNHGAFGRMMGGGGGGSAIFMIKKEQIESWKERVAEEYQDKTGLEPEFYDAIPSEGARIVWRQNDSQAQLRQRLVEFARDWTSFKGHGRELRLKELQALCLEILGLRHLYEFRPSKPVRTVIAASGLGLRMGAALSGPKSLYPIGGEPILLHLLRTFAPFDQEPVIVVKLGEQYRERWERPGTWELVNESVLEQDPYEKIKEIVSQAGFEATYLGQNELKGEGDAVLQAHRLLRDFDGNLLITWGDMASLHGETVLTLLMVKEASDKLGVDVPFIIGTTVKENPYAPIIRNVGGVVLGSQKGLKLPLGEWGEDDAGVFVGNAREVFHALMEYPFVEQEGKIIYVNPYNQEPNLKGEMNTAQISAIFAQEGKEAMALPIARVEEAKGVNDTEQADQALAYRQRFQEEALSKIARARDLDTLADLVAVMPMSEGVVRGVLERLRQIIPQAQDDEQRQAALEAIAAKLRGFGNGARADQFLQILSRFHSPTQLQTAL